MTRYCDSVRLVGYKGQRSSKADPGVTWYLNHAPDTDQLLTLVSFLKALAAALSEARRQHPELSVTRVVVHKETEVSPEHVIE